MLVESLTERTTAATDLLVGAVAFGCLCRVMLPLPRGVRRTCWAAVFALLGTSAVLGGLVHGLGLPEGAVRLLWHPLYLLLGLTVAFFGAAALVELRGEARTGRARLAAIAVGVIFYLVTCLTPDLFIVFVLYELAMMLFALVACSWLLVKSRLGAGWLVAGVVVTIVAAGVQASSLEATLIWPFDHNGLFHLVQLPGILLLARGVRLGGSSV